MSAQRTGSGRARAVTGLVLAVASVTAVLAAPAPARACAPAGWRPDVRSAIAYARTRRGTVAFHVRTERRAWGYHPGRSMQSMSVLKAMLMVAYLNRATVRNRPLRPRDLRLVGPMIRRSDNDTAYRVRVMVGAAGLRRVARRARMRSFAPAGAGQWGASQIDAIDQTRLWLHYEQFIPRRHRAVALLLLRTITPSQRWGIGRVRPPGWRLFFKGGWGSGTGAFDHQVALLFRGRARVAVAVLTSAQGTHAYGKETLRGVSARLLRGLAHPRRPGECRLR